MKIEKLSNKKRIIISIIIFIGIIGIITIANSRAAYKSTDSIEIVRGNIQYSIADFNVVAIYIQDIATNEDGYQTERKDTYHKQNNYQVPTGKQFSLNTEKSTCTGGKENKLVYGTDNSKVKGSYTITVEYNSTDGILSFGNVKEGNTKCNLYFDEKITNPVPGNADKTLAKLKALNSSLKVDETDFDTKGVSGVDTADHTGILYKAKDNDGISYFYRGQAPDNWVQFAGKKWRIIRINGDGTIRLIYQCTGVSCNKAESPSTKSKYCPFGGNNTYVGFYYGKANGTTFEETHSNAYKSTMAQTLRTWYGTEIPKVSREYIDSNAGFCNDRMVYSGSGIGSSTSYYAAYGRIAKNPAHPTFVCGSSADTTNEEYKRDYFTMEGATKGNAVLDVPIGLITVDEMVLAGGFYQKDNEKFYLSCDAYGSYCFTMSPLISSEQYTVLFSENPVGYIDDAGVNGSFSYFPVINLNANVTFKTSGNGEVNNPYVVDETAPIE